MQCYVTGLYKASAVMVGAAAESIILELKDVVTTKLGQIKRSVSKDIKDWRVKTIMNGLRALFETEKAKFPNPLREEYEGYWSAFTQQIRATRNDAGHPSSIDPITPEAVHASLLIFPELAKLANKLRTWVENDLT